MRRMYVNLAVLGLAACANDAPIAPPYDEIARALAAEIAVDAGGGDVTALAEILQIARGGRQAGVTAGGDGFAHARHGDVLYQYAVTCRDEGHKRVACGEWTASAEAVVVWGGALHGVELDARVFHRATWTLRGLRTGMAWATGTSVSAYDAAFVPALAAQPASPRYWITSTREAALVVDPGPVAVLGGSMTATVEAGPADDPDGGPFAVDAIVTFERPGRARIDLDGDHAYWLDTTTGAVATAVVLD